MRNLLIVLWLVPAVGWCQMTELKEDSLSLIQAIEWLEKEHQVKFAFEHTTLLEHQVKSSLLNQPLDELLPTLLEHTNFRYEIHDQTILLIPRRNDVLRNLMFKGVVFDEQSSEPLPHASIRLVNVGKYTVTNKEGRFGMMNVPFDTSLIEIRYIGYDPIQIRMSELLDFEKVKIALKPSSEQLEDVLVEEYRNKLFDLNVSPSQTSIDVKKFNAITNFGEPDVIRSVQLLPGISATNETSAGLNIRGGSPQQNLVLFDNFTVYQLDHFFGIFSAFNSNVIKDVQLYKSAYAAPWGTRVSGVMDITSKSGNQDKVSGSLGVNLFSANAVLEVPVGKKTSLLFAGRRAYTDVIQSDLYKKVIGQRIDGQSSLSSNTGIDAGVIDNDFYFYDVNAKLTHRFDDKNQLHFSYYSGKDDLIQSGQESYFFGSAVELKEESDWGNRGMSLAYGRQWSDRLYTNFSLSQSEYFKNLTSTEFESDSIDADLNIYEYTYNYSNKIKEVNVKLDAELKIDASHQLNFGIYNFNSSVSYNNLYTYQFLDFESESDSDLGFSDQAVVSGLYFQHLYTPNGRTRVKSGLRATAYSLSDKIFIAPRFSISHLVGDLLTLKLAAGKYHQFLVSVDTEDPSLSDGGFWLMSDEEEGVPHLNSNHLMIGATIDHAWFELDAELYYKSVDGLLRYNYQNPNFLPLDEVDTLSEFSNGNGRTYGLELMLRKGIGSYIGWIAYTLSKNENRFEDLNDNNFFASDWDERHEVKLVNVYKFRNWEFSSTWIYGSGKPYDVTPLEFDFIVDFENGESLDPQVYIGESQQPNARRIPAYHKLDLGVSYVWSLEQAHVRFGLNLLNVYNRKNIKSITEYELTGDLDFEIVEGEESSLQTKVELLGFTPSVFININF